ncbi:amidohydrolase [Halobacillus naozhouensis]|uniref:Amidohydrolase n=1 Tax=Halobacillus naozhouensis TaxID=554880 RepID=A0ABY8IZ48_9BACI|nr:amidohydrolase [Halobacillus naozhouensis]WFT75483.1 amidohydrolase [Halobacillus naozhouensis]
MRKPDVIFFNGDVLTMDDSFPQASAVAVKDGMIVAVGDESDVFDWKTEHTKIIDLNGKTLMPGFIESHIHPTIYGSTLLEIDCRPETTPAMEDLLQKVSEEAVKTPEDEWIRGFGWDDSKLVEMRNPTRWELDEAAPNHPVVLKRSCAHMAVANSKALEMSGITQETPDPSGGHIERDENGNLTGLLQEKAQGLLDVPRYDLEDMAEGMRLAQQQFAEWGITTVHDMSTQTTDLQLFQYLQEQNELRVRVRPWIWAIDQNGFDGSLDEVLKVGLRSGFGNDLVKIQGMKFMLDGSVGGKTAAMHDPYVDTEEKGILYNSVEEIHPLMEKAIESGLRVAVHAIGDRAIEVAIESFEQIHNNTNITGMRNRVEHCVMPTVDHLRRMKNLELVAASSIGFLYHIGDNYVAKLGAERVNHLFPHKSFKEHGIVAPGNSDLPVNSGNPWQSIYSAVTRKTSSGQVVEQGEQISVWDALKAFTVDAAYSSCEEQLLGVIKEGSKADLIVLSENPLEVKPDHLKEMKVQQTYLEGDLTFSQSQSYEEVLKG